MQQDTDQKSICSLSEWLKKLIKVLEQLEMRVLKQAIHAEKLEIWLNSNNSANKSNM